MKSFSSSASLARIPKPPPKHVVIKPKIHRKADDISYSIWAKDVIKRGGNLNDALAIIEERVLKTPTTSPTAATTKTSLLNSAIDMCGHAGNLKEASRILSLMEAKGIRRDERTLCSLLNAIATFSQNLPKDFGAIANDGHSVIISDKKEEDETGLRSIEQTTSLSPFKEPENKTEAMRLAITLYSTFLQRSRTQKAADQLTTKTPALFNTFLKTIWKCDMAPVLLPSIFPPPPPLESERTAKTTQPTDITTYTTAIMAYNSAIRDVHRTEQEKREMLAIAISYFTSYKGTVDSAMMMAVLLCIKGRLWGLDLGVGGGASDRLPMKAGNPELLMEKKMIYRFLAEKVAPLLRDMFALSTLPVPTMNTFLSIMGRLKGVVGVSVSGCKEWREEIWKEIGECESIKRSSKIDSETITLLGYVVLRNKECPLVIMDSIDGAKERGGLHISLSLMKLYFLAALSTPSDKITAANRCWKLFEQVVLSPQTQPNAFMRSNDHVMLDCHCVKILVDIVKKGDVELRTKRLRSIKKWLLLLPRIKEDGRCSKKSLIASIERYL